MKALAGSLTRLETLPEVRRPEVPHMLWGPGEAPRLRSLSCGAADLPGEVVRLLMTNLTTLRLRLGADCHTDLTPLTGLSVQGIFLVSQP